MRVKPRCYNCAYSLPIAEKKCYCVFNAVVQAIVKPKTNVEEFLKDFELRGEQFCHNYKLKEGVKNDN